MLLQHNNIRPLTNIKTWKPLHNVTASTLYPQLSKVNQSRYRPEVAQRVPGSLRFPDFMTTAQDGGKVVSLTHRPPLPLRKYSWYSFLLEAESTPGP